MNTAVRIHFSRLISIGNRSQGQPKKVGKSQTCQITMVKNIEESVLAERDRESREREQRERHDMRKIREMKDEIEALRRKVEEQKLRADRDALHAEVARGAGGRRSGGTTARDSTSSPAVPTSGLAAQPGTSQISLSRPNWSQLKNPVDCMLGYDADMMTVEYCRGFQ